MVDEWSATDNSTASWYQYISSVISTMQGEFETLVSEQNLSPRDHHGVNEIADENTNRFLRVKHLLSFTDQDVRNQANIVTKFSRSIGIAVLSVNHA